MDYEARLNRAIPGGAHTYSRGFDQFPANAPQILERGKGAYVWDPEGNRYLDYGMALRAVSLGYAHPRVNAAAIREIERGNNLTRASLTELAAAEMMIDLIPSVEMVKFAKNGSNATSAAVKIARAYTGRRYVCVPRQQPFFSFDDWFIGVTPLTRGIPDIHAASTLLFDYNDPRSLEALFAQYSEEIAAVMLEPATTILPDGCPLPLRSDSATGSTHFLHQVQEMCRRDGALFILDEMITGFRWHLHGAQTYFGVAPDICTFGKGMANGFSVAAVGGRRDVMEVGAINKKGAERTFLLSTTHGGEMSGLGAFIETARIFKEEDVCGYLWQYGEKLRDGLEQLAKESGLAEYFVLEGSSVLFNFVTRDESKTQSMKYRALFSQEMIRNGVLMPWVGVSQAHTDIELGITLAAASKAFRIYAAALNDGVEKYLVGSELKPVFRKFN